MAHALLAAAFIPMIVLLILFTYRDLLEPTVPATSALVPNNEAAEPVGGLAFLRVPAVWMCFAFFFITALALGGIQSFSSSSLCALYGLSLLAATTSYRAYMLSSAAGMVWGGFLASRIARHDRIIALSFTAAGLMALIIATGWVAPWMAVVLMGAVGFGAGVAGPSRDLLIRAVAPKNATSRVYGVVYSELDIGLAGVPLLFGALMDAHHPSWVFLLIGMFQMMVIATALSVGTRTARHATSMQVA